MSEARLAERGRWRTPIDRVEEKTVELPPNAVSGPTLKQ